MIHPGIQVRTLLALLVTMIALPASSLAQAAGLPLPPSERTPIANPCTNAEVTVVLAFNLYQGHLEDRELSTMDRLASWLAACPTRAFELQLHTDTVRSSEFNAVASQRVAEHIRELLVARGVVTTRLAPCGYGETRPLSIDPSWDQRTPNQRLVLRLLPGGAAAHRCPAPG